MPLIAHFLNVGQGDCTIIQFPSGRVAIVDIDHLKVFDPDTRLELLAQYRESRPALLTLASLAGPPVAEILEDSYLRERASTLTDPFDYYERNVGANISIFRLIITHPDMDHMTGLDRLNREKVIYNFWHVGPYDFNLATTTNQEWEASPYDRRDWAAYKQLRAGNGTTSLQRRQGDQGQFWTEDGIELWAPSAELVGLARQRQQSNILSMILKISYRGRSIVLGGDATADETWATIYNYTNLQNIDVLKASHHGRRSGYYGPAVKEMSPWLTITSVGEKNYDATDNYRRYSDYTVSLRNSGDIKVTISDDGNLYYDPPDLADHWKARKS